MKDLAGETFILYGDQHGALLMQSNAFVAACRAAGFSPRIRQIVPHISARPNLIAAGFGVAVVALHISHADERREHEEAIERLKAEHKRLQARIDGMYIDKLDGRIGDDFFDRMARQWREEKSRCLNDIERHQNAEQSYMDEGVQLFELARKLRFGCRS